MEDYHNYRRTETECSEGIIFCCIDKSACEHYGTIHRTFDPSKARIDNGKALELAKKFYLTNDIKNEVYPAHIVETAGVWDDIQFIDYLYDLNYFNDFDAILTPDGAVVFDSAFMVRK